MARKLVFLPYNPFKTHERTITYEGYMNGGLFDFLSQCDLDEFSANNGALWIPPISTTTTVLVQYGQYRPDILYFR